MIIEGMYNSAKIFAKTIDEGAISQIKMLCDMEFLKSSKIRIMPDVHVGVGATIGTTMTIEGRVVPNLVGVDIGCGMETVKIRDRHIELEKLDKFIQKNIPSGFNIRKSPHHYNEDIDLESLRSVHKGKINLQRARLSIGTLGGGNHFIEVNKDEDNNLYLVVHSGSRHLGSQIASYYQNLAYDTLNERSESYQEEIIRNYKSQGREKEINKALKQLKKQIVSDIPKPLAYLEGELMEDYFHDMKIAQHFATLNRKAIIDTILKGMKLKVEDGFTTIHNYIDTDEMILRKGAISANKDEIVLIPLNMRDGSLICKGKGNPDWNYSAPHGAGRLLSRKLSKETYTLKEMKEEMKGIFTSSLNKDTLDEAPMAYKDMEEIIEGIGPATDIISHIKPIYNFKAGDER